MAEIWKTVIAVGKDGRLEMHIPKGVETLRIGPVEHMVKPPGEEKVITTIDISDLDKIRGREFERRWHEPTPDKPRGYAPSIEHEQVWEEYESRKKGGAPAENKTYITRKTLTGEKNFEGLIVYQLGEGKFGRPSGQAFTIADSEYYCPPLEDALKIIQASEVECKKWASNRFDCDDFAYVLKAHFAEAAYAEGERKKGEDKGNQRAAHCFGIVMAEIRIPKLYGKEYKSHAINWMVNDDLKLRFVEPQKTDPVFCLGNPEEFDIKCIDVMLA
jgi:hypothetical protein